MIVDLIGGVVFLAALLALVLIAGRDGGDPQ